MPDWKVLEGDCVALMAGMAEASVDAVVCDPPYHLTFMGRTWDHAPSPAESQAMHLRWAREALRVLKPGGHLLAFGGTRTYHRLACAVEDAGFEIRDTISWMYGSGFPKSLAVDKAIDKAAGAERETVGQRVTGGMGGGRLGSPLPPAGIVNGARNQFKSGQETVAVTAPATPDAERWEGWGTALKPSHEPIVVARKPLSGTVAATVLEHGTGALNIDGCRVESSGRPHIENAGRATETGIYSNGKDGSRSLGVTTEGRWPPNVVLSHHESCVPVGTRRVKSGAGQADYTPTGNQGAVPVTRNVKTGAHFGDADGLETVVEYRCDPSCPVRLLDEQTGTLHSQDPATRAHGGKPKFGQEGWRTERGAEGWYGDSGSASRFFPSFEHQDEPRLGDMGCAGYTESSTASRGDMSGSPGGDGTAPSAVPPAGSSTDEPEPGGAERFRYVAKASSAERNAGLDGFEERLVSIGDERPGGGMHERYGSENGSGRTSTARNVHPTVKPIELMRWLVRLVTPPGGTCLDPFAGSGTTGCAAALEGFDFIGLEREAEYVEIARARIAWWAEHPDGMKLVERLEAEQERKTVAESGQLDLFGVPVKPVDDGLRAGEASAERRYTERGGSNFAMKPGRRRRD